MNGAAILYNLYLGELDPRRTVVIDDCDAMLQDWLELIGDRRQPLVNWDRDDFWKLLDERMYVPSTPTRLFVDEWCRRVLSGDPAQLRGAEATKELIFSRESQIKGAPWLAARIAGRVRCGKVTLALAAWTSDGRTLASFFGTSRPAWQATMLEPRDRLLLFEALKPPEGFRFDQGIGTTYSLDLLALLTVPLAFTWFEQQGDEDQRAGVNSLEILESLRRHADQLTIFCHAGRIALPKTSYPQLAFVESSIVECQPAEGAAFHPKVWVLRWVNDAGDVRYRVLCLSRNLTFARSWDTLLALDGELSPNRRAAIGRNKGLVDFVRALPRVATRKPPRRIDHPASRDARV